MINCLQTKYTVELRYLVDDKNFDLFDFDYPYIDESLKPNFEKLFIDKYYFNEIGFETVARFKHRLRTKLELIMPYYKQLYETELESKKCNFLLNKDLKETFIRTLDNKQTESAKQRSNTNNNTIDENKNNDDYKESNIDNGLASLDMDSLTTVSKTNGSSSTKNNSQSNGVVDNDLNRQHKENEKTELLSQGNIGTTSSGQLLEDWRKILININEMIIKDCRNLFMLVY